MGCEGGADQVSRSPIPNLVIVILEMLTAISITPLKANFATSLGPSHQKELKL